MQAAHPLNATRRRSHALPTAVGYVRRSTDRQEQSIPDQQRAIERYASEKSLSVSRFYVDDAISGTSTVNRRGFQELIADAQKKDCPFSFIIVYDVKRFGRVGNDEAGYYRHVLRSHGVEVLYVSENFSGDGTDDLLRPVKQWQAREESKDLSRVTIRGLLSRVETGCWMGGAPPYGYDLQYESGDGALLFVLRYHPDGSKELLDEGGAHIRKLPKGESIQVSKRDQARLVPSHEDRVIVIRRIFEAAAQDDKGLGAIAEQLNRDGVPAPRGPLWARMYQGAWTKGTVRAILDNPVYTGDLVWNRRTDARFFKIKGGRATERREAFGARLVPNPKEDWITVRDVHPALVSRRLFERASEVRTRKPVSSLQAGQNPRVVGGWNGQRSRFLLSGIAYCSRCGGRYEGRKCAKGKPKTDGTRVVSYSYGCGSYIRKGRSACSLGSVPQAAIEEAVVAGVLVAYQRFRGPEGRVRVADAMKHLVDADIEDLAAAKTRAREEAAEVEAAIARLLDHLSEATRTVIEERIATLSTRRSAVRARQLELERLEISRAEAEELVQATHRFLEHLEQALRCDSPEQRVVTLRRCVEKIVVDAEDQAAVLTLRAVPQPELADRTADSKVELRVSWSPQDGSIAEPTVWEADDGTTGRCDGE